MHETHLALNWTLGWVMFVCCLGFALAAWWRGANETPVGSTMFVLAALGAIIAFRAPILAVPFELHPDESQLISGGMMLSHDPVFWRSVDGDTSGPLNYYALVVPALLADGRPYLAARVLGLGLVGFVVVGSFLISRALFSERIARVGTLPLVAFFAFATHPEHVHHGSEHLPMALTTAALGCVVYHVVRGARGALLLAGTILAALPFSKMQAGPIAVAIFIAVAFTMARRERATHARCRAVAPLFLGAAATALAVALYATAFGLWRDIKIAYFDANLSWVRGARPRDLALLGRLVWRTFESHGALYLSGAVGLPLLCRAFVGGWQRSERAWYYCVIGVAAVAAIASVVNAGQGAPKHLLLVVPAFGLLAPVALAGLEACPEIQARRVCILGIVAFLGAGVVCPAVARAGITSDDLPHYPNYLPEREPIMQQIVAELKRWVGPDDYLAAWPGPPECYVRVGCRQATRDGETSRQSILSPEREYFRARYMRDIQASRPRAFLDYTRRYRRGFEVDGFPVLARYLELNYRLEKDIAGGLIYVRRDLPPRGG